jgi:hypothetical protein
VSRLRWGWIWIVLFGPRLIRAAEKDPELAYVLIAAAVLVGGVCWVWRRRRLRTLFLASVPQPENAGIVFLESKGETLPSESRCLICRAGLTGDVIYCGRCHTPLHRECYHYLGTCPVYACGNRQYRRAG